MVKGRVRSALSIAGGGTAVALEPGFEGRVGIGERVVVPLKGGARVMTVLGVEAVDGIGGDRRDSAVALVFDLLDPEEVVVGAEVIDAAASSLPDDPPRPKLPEPFAPTGPKLTRLNILPPPPVRQELFADEARFAGRLGLLLGLGELSAWAMLVAAVVRAPRGLPILGALYAWALLRALRPLWSWLGTRLPRPLVAGVLLAISAAALGAAVLGPLFPQDQLAALLLACALSALPALGDLAQSHLADAVTVERRGAAYARLEMGQGLGAALGIALGCAVPRAAPVLAAAAVFASGLLVPDLRDRGTRRSTWPLAVYRDALAAPLPRALFTLALLLGVCAGLALAGLHRPVDQSWTAVSLLLPPLGMMLAARVEPRSRNAVEVPGMGAAAAGGALLLALAAGLLGWLAQRGLGGQLAAAAAGWSSLGARWAALFALGIACTALPAAVARGAAELERPIASSLCWSGLGAACALGAAALLW